MDWLNQILEEISGWLWGWPMIILLLGTHIYLTIILRFPQRKIFTAIRLSVKRDPNASGDVSQFKSLATALAATIGTGNIIGVATAVALGGPGAVLWCWLTGVLASPQNMQKDYWPSNTARRQLKEKCWGGLCMP